MNAKFRARLEPKPMSRTRPEDCRTKNPPDVPPAEAWAAPVACWLVDIALLDLSCKGLCTPRQRRYHQGTVVARRGGLGGAQRGLADHELGRYERERRRLPVPP